MTVLIHFQYPIFFQSAPSQIFICSRIIYQWDCCTTSQRHTVLKAEIARFTFVLSVKLHALVADKQIDWGEGTCVGMFSCFVFLGFFFWIPVPFLFSFVPVNGCMQNQYRCQNGICMNITSVCDGDMDCFTNDEEADCASRIRKWHKDAKIVRGVVGDSWLARWFLPCGYPRVLPSHNETDWCIMIRKRLSIALLNIIIFNTTHPKIQEAAKTTSLWSTIKWYGWITNDLTCGSCSFCDTVV